MKIVIDPGHGGRDPGAVGHGLRESDLTGDIVSRVAAKLAAYEATVLQVPRYDDLAARAVYANENGADLFLSIHCNAGGGTGFESYVHPSAGGRTQEIQTVIHSAVMAFLEQHNVINRGRRTANFQVLRETAMPAVLLECLFIDHAEDAELLADSDFRARLANEIAFGVSRALGLKLKDPCHNCQRVNELIIENSKLFSQMQTLKQIIRQAQNTLGGI